MAPVNPSLVVILFKDRSLGLLQRLQMENRAVAAVEFALLLPLMLTMYLGCSEITQAVIATRKVSVLARSLADLAAQQPAGTPLDSTQTGSILDASLAIMAPFTGSSAQMTLSSVRFWPNGGGLDAKVAWTTQRNGGTLRPCGVVLTKTANGSAPSPSTMPTGFYIAGSVIVADVTYTYVPTFAHFVWSAFGRTANTGYQMEHTSYMRPRTQDHIDYTGQPGVAPNC